MVDIREYLEAARGVACGYTRNRDAISSVQRQREREREDGGFESFEVKECPCPLKEVRTVPLGFRELCFFSRIIIKLLGRF